jgi:hypothetical protein
MAHKLKGSIIEIPVMVRFEKAYPCTWRVLPSIEKKGKLLGGSLVEDASPSPISLSEDRDDEPINFSPEIQRHWYFDPWEVRKAFLAVKTDDEILAFLNETGRFERKADALGLWGFDDFREWQRVVKELLKPYPRNWLNALSRAVPDQTKRILFPKDFSGQFQSMGYTSHVVITMKETLSALLATVFIDRLRGAKIKFCARPDCKKEFQVKSNHRRDYCTQSCAHLQSLRRLRARRRKKSPKLR